MDFTRLRRGDRPEYGAGEQEVGQNDSAQFGASPLQTLIRNIDCSPDLRVDSLRGLFAQDRQPNAGEIYFGRAPNTLPSEYVKERG